MEPAVQTLVFGVPSGTSFIDLSQVASIVNRRFYRQGINWSVAGFKFIGINSAGVIQISKLPNTWTLSNSWTKSFKAWQRMINDATAEAPSIKGKFLDFKIFADADHHQAGFAQNLLPYAGFSAPLPGAQFVAGEWTPSHYEIPGVLGSTGVVTFDLIAVGANNPGVSPATGNDAKSMIQGYADSRALPYAEDPATPADADVNWMAALFNDGSRQTTEVLAELETAGDEAPYPYEGDGTHTDTMYPGGETNVPHLQTHDYEFVTGSTVGGTTRLKGGNFPCGLIRIDVTSTEVTTYQLIVDLVPGYHRGYHCESMLEM